MILILSAMQGIDDDGLFVTFVILGRFGGDIR